MKMLRCVCVSVVVGGGGGGGESSLCRGLGPLVKRNIIQLCDYTTTESARLAEIPVLWCRDPKRKFSKLSPLPGSPANEPSEKQDSG